jgi:prophage regulatory protein
MGIQSATTTPSRILRKPTVVDRVGLSDTTIWRLERAGRFPKRVQLGANSIGWIEREIDDWIAQRAEAVSR